MAGNITILYCSFVCIDDGDVGPEIDRESFYDVFESFGWHIEVISTYNYV